MNNKGADQTAGLRLCCLQILEDRFSRAGAQLSTCGTDGASNCYYSYPSVETYVVDAQKNRLIETVLLSTHNIFFG